MEQALPEEMLEDQDQYDDEHDMHLLQEDEEDEIEMDMPKQMSHQQQHLQHHVQFEEPVDMVWPDMLNNGFDDEFNDDPLDKAENPDPYFDMPRQLSTEHIYLTVRHKKVVTQLEHVLEWIANSNYVEDRGILNPTKPLHPPMVTNSRSYAFFVAGAAIFPHDINRDDFSPWSHNGNADNPTCYRTKVRKLGVISDPKDSLFKLKDGNYNQCPYHMVYLYSINPKDPRLRKKIYYLMETQSKMVVSHALIIYDYNSEGNIVKLNTGAFKPLPKKMRKFATATIINDPEDNELISESQRYSPFDSTPQPAVDGTLFLHVNTGDFWNDRNRQIQFLVNEPNIVIDMGCLNHKVPDLPPAVTSKGTFAFFISLEEVNFRTLTVDKLVPWSENISSNPHGITKRPKSAKTPLFLNDHNQLRVLKNPLALNQEPEYLLHVYTATLPRCLRLRKKVVYVQRGGRPIGHALIMYYFTEPGEPPQPLEKNARIPHDWYNSLDSAVRSSLDHYVKSMTPIQVCKEIKDEHGVDLSPSMIYSLANRVPQESELDGDNYVTEWSNADGSAPTTSAKMEEVEEIVIEEEVPEAIMEGEVMIEGDCIVGHEEEVVDSSQYETPRRNPFLDQSTATSGYVRGIQRYDAMWRIAQETYGNASLDYTFDNLFRLLYEKNENRLLQMVSKTFHVDIIPGEPIEDDSVHYMQEQDRMMDEQEMHQGNHLHLAHHELGDHHLQARHLGHGMHGDQLELNGMELNDDEDPGQVDMEGDNKDHMLNMARSEVDDDLA